MNGARRAKRRVGPIVVVLAIIIFAVLGVVGLSWTRTPNVRTVPVPGPTWTSFVAETPQVCRDAMQAADTMFERSMDANLAAIKAANLSNANNPQAALDQIETANKAIKKLEVAEDRYLKLSKGCKG